MPDFPKLALVHMFAGFQAFMVTFGVTNYRLSGVNKEEEDDAVQAFLIMAFLFFVIAFVLDLLLTFGSLKGNKIATIATIVLAILACVCTVIGIAIYGDNVNNPPPYSMTSYVTGATLALMAGIFLILGMCGCG